MKFLAFALFLAIPAAAVDPSPPRHFRLSPPAPASVDPEISWKTNKIIVRAVRGTLPEIFSGSNAVRTAKVGSTLTEHDTIRTFPNTFADLFLGENGPVIRVAEDSVLTILRLRITPAFPERRIQTIVRLRKGRILGSVKKMHEESVYKILTPCGVARVRGTEYSASADDCHFNVVSGEAAVWHRFGGLVKVSAGQQTSPPVSQLRVAPADNDHPERRPLFILDPPGSD